MRVFSKNSGEPKFKEAKPKRSFKQRVKNATVTATSFVLGDAHFVMQSATDGIARTEATIVHRLTGELKPDLRKKRRASTAAKQEFIKQHVNDLIAQAKAIVNADGDDAIINEINHPE